ncbi:restriction endonuclease subunit S [Methanorbis furvi]
MKGIERRERMNLTGGKKEKWPMVRLGDVCDILDSQRVPVTESKRVKGPYPYYGANGIQDYINDYIFDGELVLLAEDGGYFGDKTRPIAYRVSGKCWVNNHAHVLRPKQDSHLDIDYLNYSLMYYDVSKLINGTTRSKLNQAAVRRMTIPLPPLPEQQRIAAVLDHISSLIALRKAQIEKLDMLVKARFVEMFGDPVKNEMGWDLRTIGSFANVVTGATPNRNNSKYYENGVVPWIKTGEIEAGYIYNSEEYISEMALTDTNCKLLPVNTIMVAMYGQGKTRGQVGILKIEAATNQACGAILPNNKYCPEYLYYHLKLEYNQLRGLGRGCQQTNLNLSIVKNFPIMDVPLDIQQRFIPVIERIENEKCICIQALEKLEIMKKSLMQEFFG